MLMNGLPANRFSPRWCIGLSQMALTLLAERREPSGEWPVDDGKPAGWRPSATETQSKVSAIGLQPALVWRTGFSWPEPKLARVYALSQQEHKRK